MDELTKRQDYIDPESLAMIFAGLGQKEDALNCLERACEMRSSGIKEIGWVGWYRELRSDERFQRLMHRMGIQQPKDT